jgi:carbon monoxide dehydrogenase subunit G
LVIENEFSVALAAEVVWPLLTDIERISPCIPGFQLQEIEGDEFRGSMTLKVGAVVASYACRITFTELDEEHLRATLRVIGNETASQGGMEATVVAELTSDGSLTNARMTADVAVTGRLARFGRNILADVSRRLTKQFATSFEQRVASAAI